MTCKLFKQVSRLRIAIIVDNDKIKFKPEYINKYPKLKYYKGPLDNLPGNLVQKLPGKLPDIEYMIFNQCKES